MKLHFHGWQPDGKPGRGLALFNDESGSTITWRDNAEIVACCLMLCHKVHGIAFMSDLIGNGFSVSANPLDAWIFHPERAYEMKQAREMIERIEAIFPGGKGLIVSLAEAVELLHAYGYRFAVRGFFYGGSLRIRDGLLHRKFAKKHAPKADS